MKGHSPSALYSFSGFLIVDILILAFLIYTLYKSKKSLSWPKYLRPSQANRMSPASGDKHEHHVDQMVKYFNSLLGCYSAYYLGESANIFGEQQATPNDVVLSKVLLLS